MPQASNPGRTRPYLPFEEHTVARILHASHTTQRNAQQCLIVWDRCNDILAYLNSPDRDSDPNELEDGLDQSRFIVAFDAMLMKTLLVLHVEAKSSMLSAETRRTFVPNRKEMREICYHLHERLFERVPPEYAEWKERFSDAEKFDARDWCTENLEIIQDAVRHLWWRAPRGLKKAATAAENLCAEQRRIWDCELEIRERATDAVAALAVLAIGARAAWWRRGPKVDWDQSRRALEESLSEVLHTKLLASTGE